MVCKIRINLILMLVNVVVVLTGDSNYKYFTIDDTRLCSQITKRKVQGEGIIVSQGNFINRHSIAWEKNNYCKFQIQSAYHDHDGGVVAVIQNAKLRINGSKCIDYIKFGHMGERICGNIQASKSLDPTSDSSNGNNYFGFASNVHVHSKNNLDVEIFISKEPLRDGEHTMFTIAFTSFANCLYEDFALHENLKSCSDFSEDICINNHFFNDDVYNCPFYGCSDEHDCSMQFGDKPAELSLGTRVMVGSLSALFVMFSVFIVCLWVLKKHKLLCWAEEFSRPSETPSNRNSRVAEVNEETGARLAEIQTTTPSAPPAEEDKDLPPSYESLFPHDQR